MTKWGKRLFSIAFSFMFLFISIGYAQIADTLVINGDLSYYKDSPTDIVVIAVSPYGNSNTATSTEAGFVYGTTNVNTALKGTAGQSVTYKVTLKNYNENADYAFNRVECKDISLTEGNQYFENGLTVSVKTADGKDANGAQIKSGETLELYATYTIGDAAPQNEVIATMLHYSFAVNFSSLGGYMPAETLAKFAEILNGTKVTYTADEANALVDGIGKANPFTGKETVTTGDILAHLLDTQSSSSGAYVGNVSGSTSEETMVLEELFNGELQLDVYDPDKNAVVEKDMTCMVKEEDVTGDGAVDMTLYLTAEQISGQCNAGGLFNSLGWYKNTYISVYAVVFTKVGDKWVQLGDIYEGQAYPNNYTERGGLFSGPEANSFNTDTWVSTAKTYTVIDALTGKSGSGYVSAYSYTVAAKQKISALTRATDSTANSTLASLLRTADIVLAKGNITGSAIDDLTAVKAEVMSYFGSEITSGTGGSYTVASSVTRARMEPYIKELRGALNPFINIL
ncbi:MAG: hypothetical protein IJX27_00255 [Clostridia bacterium]|nr:hypothetical protein [Clostridia bacterium]